MTQNLYLNIASSTIFTNANKIVDGSGGAGSPVTNLQNLLGSQANTWGELEAKGQATWQAFASPNPPSKLGFLCEFFTNKLLPAATWNDTIVLNLTGLSSVLIDLLHRFYAYNQAQDAFTHLADSIYSNLTVNAGIHPYSQNVALPEMRLPSGVYLYQDFYCYQHANSSGGVIAICQTLNVDAGSTANSYSTGPDPLDFQYNSYYINLTNADLLPFYKQGKPLPRVETQQEVIHNYAQNKSFLFSQKIYPTVWPLSVQMSVPSGAYPVLSIYRITSAGNEDLMLSINDNQVYTLDHGGKMGISNDPLLCEIRGDGEKIVSLAVYNVLSR